MGIDFGKVISLKKVMVDKEDLEMRERKLSSPMLTDRSLIPTLYEVFKDFVKESGGKPLQAHQRRKFVFIAIYLYFPKALVGGKMSKNLRNDISKAIPDVKSHSVISTDILTSMFMYQNYKDFRKDVDGMFERIVCHLRSMSVLP